MSYSAAFDALVHAIKRHEGCRLHAYQDVAGIWTIGYGETEGVKPGDVWTQEQADSRLRIRVGQFLAGVFKRCPQLHNEPPERWIACTDLAYNIGLGAFAASSVCRYTKRKQYQAAADSFLLWNKAGGKVILGLTKRRQWERMVYLNSDHE